MENKQTITKSKVNKDNQDVWLCKCCDQLDIKQIELNCTGRNSPKSDSQSCITKILLNDIVMQ